MEFGRAQETGAPVISDETKGLLALLAAAPVAAPSFRMLREGGGITQQEIAEKCRVTSSTVSRWEAGTTPLPEEALLELFKVLVSRAAPPPPFTGAYVARLRRALRMRQVDFAAVLGVSIPT